MKLKNFLRRGLTHSIDLETPFQTFEENATECYKMECLPQGQSEDVAAITKTIVFPSFAIPMPNRSGQKLQMI